MKRKIIKIDEEKCNGCGLCIPNCHEGALQVVNGKLMLINDVYCDGLGACMGSCPQSAISIEERESEAFDEKKVVEQKLLKELEEHFGSDIKRINHAKKVLGFAEQLLETEPADRLIVIAASILHDAGIKIAEEKYNSSAGCYQEKEGPAVARAILNKIKFNQKDIDEICEIIAHHHTPGKVNTQNFKVLYDADWLVNLKDEADIKDKAGLKGVINKVFLTPAGKTLAQQLYL